jgi:mannosyl-3-phosphoglycerate phosphatase
MNNTETLTTKWQTLIFTDLDGSLLDHFNYEVGPADQVLTYLENQTIPVIFNTSKTFDEVLVLRIELNNHHPFIVENGAAIYIPKGYFPESHSSKFTESSHPDYLKVSLSEDRAYWLKVHEMGPSGITRATGLSEEKAVLANRREYSEPILWEGDKNKKIKFINDMRQSGANIEEGGRFLHLIGHCNKGKALTFLLNIFQQQQVKPILSIALGDGKNDVPMLAAAEEAILIRSPVHPFPDIPNQDHILKTDHYGPHGWAEGITKILKLYSIDF